VDVTYREFRIQDLVWQKEQGTDVTVSSSSAYGPSGLDLSSNSTAQVRQVMNADGVRNKRVAAPGLRVLQRWHTKTAQARGSLTPRCITACGGWHGHGLALEELAGSIGGRSAPAFEVLLNQDM